jgi:hypothetical protein
MQQNQRKHTKSTALTQMDVDHQKTRREILDLRGQKARIEHTTPKETITTLEAAIQAEGEAGVRK